MTASPTARPVVVLGDALLDVDVVGRADRLTPDAPVPVVQVEREVSRPGGAGLTALLVRRLLTEHGERSAQAPDSEVVLVAPLAADAAGERIRSLLADAGVRLVALRRDGATPVKRRVLAAGQSVVRLDEGGPAPLDGLPEEARAILRSARVVLVSDYGQGLTATPDLAEALAEVTAPVVWDPHPRGARPVPGVRLVTPSEAEARALSGDLDPASRTRLAEVTARADRLVDRWQAHAVAVTLGADGALLSHGDGPPTIVPAADVVRPRDTCGAGDCFAAAAAVALARGALVSEAVSEAVATAGRFVAAGGAGGIGETGAPASGPGPRPPAIGLDAAHSLLDRVRASGGTVVATGGCFDLLHAGHVETLRAARALGDCLVVLVNSDESVRRLKGPSRPIVPVADRARVLAALDAVDAVVVFDDDTPVGTLEQLRPDVWAKGGDYSVDQLPEAELLRRWGGQTVVLPYLDGRSTTRLVQHVASRVG